MNVKTCKTCGITKDFTEFQASPKRVDRLKADCRTCCTKKQREWRLKNRDKWNQYQRDYYFEHREEKIKSAQQWEYDHGYHVPMEDARNCSLHLGVAFGEFLLSNYFEHVNRAKNNTPGYDFICSKRFKIDVKTSSLNSGKWGDFWSFRINRNKTPDYFLLLAIESRENRVPIHVWLIPGEKINKNINCYISKSNVKRWETYEKPIAKAIKCYNELPEKLK
jgi:hypothetical protein